MRHQHINKCHLKKLSAEKVLWYENVKKNYFKYYTELFYQSHFPLNQELPRRSRLFFFNNQNNKHSARLSFSS